LTAAGELIAERGYVGMTLAAVASEPDTAAALRR
jgi:AcrR family transcriptional regulator